MKARRVGAEVFYADEPVVRVDAASVRSLVLEAEPTPRRRTRLCTHRSTDDALHEMMIVHHRDAYVRPHRHFGKAESMHVIHGDTDLVLFDEAGTVTDLITLGDFGSGRPFYYRLDAPIFHALIIRSEWLVFHEVTTGPLRREDSAFAAWAPADGDERVPEFLATVEAQLRMFVEARASR